MTFRIVILAAVCTTAFAAEHDVVLLRPSRYLAEKPSMAGQVHTYMQVCRDALDVAGLSHHTIDEDLALTDGLDTGEFLICPYNPAMQDDMSARILRFLDDGGHALICYLCEEPLRDRIGIGELLYTAGGDANSFKTLRPTGFEAPGMPRLITQGSWNAFLLASLDESKCRPWLDWVAEDGRTGSGPALLVSDEAAWFGHIMVAGDLPAKARMILALMSKWYPGVWQKAAKAALNPKLGYRHAADLTGLLALAKDGPAADEAERLACDLQSLALQAEGPRPWEVCEQAMTMRARLEDIYLRSLPTRTDAMRGAWVVGVEGVGNWGWERTARAASQLGLTDLFVRVEWGGRANYKSNVLPMRVEQGEDPVADGIAACHRHGIKYHAWFINHNWRKPSADYIAEISAKGFWQYGPDGKEAIQEGTDRVYWLNPSEPGVVKLQADMMSEVAREYDVDGVHFDYIRYENYNGSYGERDRQRFEGWVGETVANWPADVLPKSGEQPEGRLHLKFCDWRVEQVSNVVRACSEAVRAADPNCLLSAAVYPSWPYHRKIVGQDWARWLAEGWIDFLCPMTYDSPSYYDRHLDRVARQREAVGEKPLMVGLGSWLHPGPVSIAEQIVADRRLGADGFLFFSLTPELVQEILPALNSSVLRQR